MNLRIVREGHDRRRANVQREQDLRCRDAPPVQPMGHLRPAQFQELEAPLFSREVSHDPDQRPPQALHLVLTPRN